MKIKISDLAKLSLEERKKKLIALVAAARKSKPKGLKRLRRELKALEVKYNLTAMKARKLLRSGQIQETDEVRDLLMKLNLIELIEKRQNER